MSQGTICLCCGTSLLRQFSHQRVYWFCPGCHQEMPASGQLGYSRQPSWFEEAATPVDTPTSEQRFFNSQWLTAEISFGTNEEVLNESS